MHSEIPSLRAICLFPKPSAFKFTISRSLFDNSLIKWAVGLRCLQLFGRIPPDLKINWKPLRVMTEKDEAEIKSKKLADYLQLVDRQIMTKQQCAQKLTEDGIIEFSEEEIAAISNEFEPENYGNAEDLLYD